MLKSLFSLCTVATLLSGTAFADEAPAQPLQTEVQAEQTLASCRCKKPPRKAEQPPAPELLADCKACGKTRVKKVVKTEDEKPALARCHRQVKKKYKKGKYPVKAETEVACGDCGRSGGGRGRDKLACGPMDDKKIDEKAEGKLFATTAPIVEEKDKKVA